LISSIRTAIAPHKKLRLFINFYFDCIFTLVKIISLEASFVNAGALRISQYSFSVFELHVRWSTAPYECVDTETGFIGKVRDN